MPSDADLPDEADGTSRAYRRYALGLLTVIYAVSFLDRQVVTILAEPIKAELGLADWQVGALSGLAFAIFYTLLGLPVARLADRGDRVTVISAALALWSAFTMLCGLAPTFPLLLAARVGVGVGEAGSVPPAHSLIAGFTPRARRASALAVHSLGIPLGSLVGLAFGGLMADAFGWRTAFLAAGAPGLVLAAIAATTLKEPRRAAIRATAGAVAATPAPPLVETLRELAAKPAFVWICGGAAFSALAFYGQSAFFGSLFLRTHKAEVAAMAAAAGLGPRGFVGVALGLVVGLCAGTGTLAGGLLADRLGKGDVKAYARLPALSLVLACPFFCALALAPGAKLALAAMAVGVLIHSTLYGPAYAAVQTLVRPTARALAAAIMLFLANLVGLGLGPLGIGLLSDRLAASLGPDAALRWAMALGGPTLALSAACFFMAGRTARADEHREGAQAPSAGSRVSESAPASP